MDRVEEFLGNRLRGRAVPKDLRRLVELQLDGELNVDDRMPPFGEIRVLEAGEVHPLEQPLEPVVGDPRPEETRANIRAIAGVLAHVAPVVDGFNGDLWGYWLHPDEPADVGPLIVKLDTEGSFGVVSGASLIEAMVFDWAGDDDVSEIAAYCDRHRIPLPARSSAEVQQVRPTLDPAALHDRLFKREHPNHQRPAWADEPGAVPDVAPIGARSDDPRVARVLVLHGFPEDPSPLIRAADVGEGEVLLRAPLCAAEFEFHRENDTTWFLHEMRFSSRASAAPLCPHVPFGFQMEESREQCWARLGEPEWKSPFMKIDRWGFGRVSLHVVYGKTGKPSAVRCMAMSGEG